MDQNPEWLSLLHVHNNHAYIRDRRFLLSWPDFSAQQELRLDLTAMLENDGDNAFVCKFPARSEWLQQKLGLAPLFFAKCTDFLDYLDHAPADTIKVVYVAENITQPSSMMGHVLLELAGINKQQQYTEHAISFYTDVSGHNAPKFMFEALVTGKKGYFSLTPLNEKLERYHHQEQRNIWTYTLQLTEEQRRRIQYHIWELKTAPLTYYFKGYNCATLTHFVLATTGNTTLNQHFGAIITPLDIAKSVNAAHLVTQTTLLPSDKFAIRMLIDQRSSTLPDQIKNAIQNHSIDKLIVNTPAPVDKFIADQIASHQIDFLWDQGKLSTGSHQILQQQLMESKAVLSDFVIDLSQYKNPLKAPDDSQISIGSGYENREHDIKFDYLPVAQKLIDDNSQSSSEHELLLADMGLKYLTQSQKLRLDYFTLYSMASYIPNDVLTGGTSGKLSIGYGPRIDSISLREAQATTVEGGLGLTHEIIPDLSISALGLAGMDYQHALAAHVTPTVELIANEKLDMKSVIEYQRIYSTEQFAHPYNAIKWMQSKRFNAQYSMQFSYETYWNQAKTTNAFALTLKKIF